MTTTTPAADNARAAADIQPDIHAPPARHAGLGLVASQTLALFLDAYRELNSRALFWIALGLSGLVALVFLAIGFGPEGISIFGYHASNFPNSTLYPPADFYKDMFLTWGLGVWITWIATILALITTAGIFPDLISGGSIDLYLSKPLGRLRLFLTKYLAGLLFVALQITVFCVACFLVIGIRGGAWAPSIFLAIPVVTLYYSFLYCVTVLVGTLTGSTLSAVLITLLFWFFLFIVNTADGSLLAFKTVFDVDAKGYAARIERDEAAVKRWEASPDTAPGKIYQDGIRSRLANDRQKQAERRATADQLAFWHNLVLGIKAPLPKTNESIEILRRWLVESEDLAPTQQVEVTDPLTGGEGVPTTDPASQPSGDNRDRDRRRRQRDNPVEAMDSDVVRNHVQAAYLQRSPFWAFGTSLMFEAVVLGIAGWRFVRRDF